MSYGSSPVEDQRPFVDNASRPGKGSKPRPLAVSKAELGRRLEAIFKWAERQNHSSLTRQEVKTAMKITKAMDRTMKRAFKKGKQRTRRAKGGRK